MEAGWDVDFSSWVIVSVELNNNAWIIDGDGTLDKWYYDHRNQRGDLIGMTDENANWPMVDLTNDGSGIVVTYHLRVRPK